MEILYLRDELTTSANSDNVLTALVRSNCLNISSEVNFNKYGVKDNIGLQAVSDVFIDCFIVQVENPVEQMDYMSNLRTLINSHGMLLSTILTIENKKFKITCCDYDLSTVMNFIDFLKTTNFKLNCIDITQDFAGSFDKEEVKRHLLDKCGFVQEPFISKSNPTIIKRNGEPQTCLQYWNGKSLRCKMYLKMPEILQSRSVRSDVGNRWLEWAVKCRRQAKSRDASINRGLTRIEVTSYMDGDDYDDHLSTFSSLISGITQNLPPNLIYSTSHSAMWNAYCDCFKHTLIISNPQFGATPDLINDPKAFPPGRALIVYSFNQRTKDISGRFINNWNSISRHGIERHTLSARLPVDILEVHNFRKATSKERGSYVEVHVTRSKYYKSEDMPLYLTKGYTIFNRKCYTKDENEQCLAQAGFIPHVNCTLTLPLQAHTKFSKIVTRLQLLCPEEEIKCNTISKKVVCAMNDLQQLKLSDLPIGFYDVKAVLPRKSTFGRFFVNIIYRGTTASVSSNKILDGSIPVGGIKAANDNSSVAQLHIIHKKRDQHRNCVVNAELII
jgi:hypothetical protein